MTPKEIEALVAQLKHAMADREDEEVTGVEVARLLGVAPATLSRWCSGARVPRGASRRLLCLVSKDPEGMLRELRAVA